MAKIKLNKKGFYDLRRASGVVADLESRAGRVRDACGDGFTTSSVQGKKAPYGRWRTTVAAYTYKARRENAKHNTILRALDAGR